MVSDKLNGSSAGFTTQEFRAHHYGVVGTSTDRQANDDEIQFGVCKVEFEILQLSLLPAWMAYEKLLRITASEVQQGGDTATQSATGFARRVEQTISVAIDRFFPLSDAGVHYAAVARIKAVLLLLYDPNSAVRLTAAGINSHQPGGNPAVLRRLVDAASWFPLDGDRRMPSGTLDYVLRDPSDNQKDRVPPKPPLQRQMPLRLGSKGQKNIKRDYPRDATARMRLREHIGRQWRYLPLLRRTVDSNLICYIGKRIGKLTVKGLWGEDPEYWVVRCVCGAYELRSRHEVSGKQPCKRACSRC